MRKVNVTELRNNLPKYLDGVQKGNELWVSSHGHVIARILPPLDTKLSATNQLKELRDKAIVGDVISPIHDHWDVNE